MQSSIGGEERGAACVNRRIKEWIHVRRREIPAHGSLRQGWHEIRTRILQMRLRGQWKAVAGPAAALALALQQIGQGPSAPWIDPRGERRRLPGAEPNLDFTAVFEEIFQDVAKQIWAKAGGHYFGNGIQWMRFHRGPPRATTPSTSRSSTRSWLVRSGIACCDMDRSQM